MLGKNLYCDVDKRKHEPYVGTPRHILQITKIRVKPIFYTRDQVKSPSWRILAVVWHGEGWALPCDIAQDSPHEMTTRKDNIPARSSPGLPRTAPSVTHQGRGVKCTTGVPNKKIRARSNTIIGTWNVRTLKNTGKLKNWSKSWPDTTGISYDCANHDYWRLERKARRKVTDCTGAA